MHMKGWAVTLGIGAAAGAVAVMMLPKQCTARKVIRKAADTVEDAVEELNAIMTAEHCKPKERMEIINGK